MKNSGEKWIEYCAYTACISLLIRSLMSLVIDRSFVLTLIFVGLQILVLTLLSYRFVKENKEYSMYGFILMLILFMNSADLLFLFDDWIIIVIQVILVISLFLIYKSKIRSH